MGESFAFLAIWLRKFVATIVPLVAKIVLSLSISLQIGLIPNYYILPKNNCL
jgi:hypothetical protein